MKRIRFLSATGTLAATGLALLVCGCGASHSPSRSSKSSHTGASRDSELVALARCMRSHGVSRFPDPPAGAHNVKFGGPQQLGVSSRLLQQAERACRHLVPAGVDDQFPRAEVQALLSGMLRFSRCMRSHGLRSWPDPTTDSQGRPVFPLSTVPGINERSPRIGRIGHECGRLLPAALGGIPIG